MTRATFVVVVVATYRRAPELKRLLESLAAVKTPMAAVIVDNAADADTEAMLKEAQALPFEIAHLIPGSNLGCGGGLAFGERAALKRFDSRITHLWVLDDDTEVACGALEFLLAALKSEGAALACPMITDVAGKIGWFPGLLERRAFDAVRTLRTPAEYITRCGLRPVPFSWATGVSLLATRQAVEEQGPHRADYWIRGEDLDFSLRVTARFPGIFVPAALVLHLPRAGADSPEAREAERVKHGVMLQNIAFISFRLPYGRRILNTVPGNVWRFLRTWGIRSLPEALKALWIGGVQGKPAGTNKA